MSEPSTPSSWYESLFGKNEAVNITRDRSNCVSNSTLPTGDSWRKFRQFFSLSGAGSSTNTEEPLTRFRYVTYNMTFFLLIDLLYKERIR